MAADLQHRDWLLFSTKQIIQMIDPSISVDIMTTANDGKVLVANCIPESSIDKLQFLVNTDQNNNYLYLEDFSVYRSGSIEPLNVPGLVNIMTNNFRTSDINGFLQSNKLHTPFSVTNFQDSTFTGTTLSEFIDQYTGLLPFSPTTYGMVKIYSFTVNPDVNYGEAAGFIKTLPSNSDTIISQPAVAAIKPALNIMPLRGRGPTRPGG